MRAPTLLIVGGNDIPVIGMNLKRLQGIKCYRGVRLWTELPTEQRRALVSAEAYQALHRAVDARRARHDAKVRY